MENSKRSSEFFFTIARLPVDWLLLVLAGLTTYILRTKILAVFRPALFEFNLPLDQYLYLAFLVSLLFIGAYAVSGLYVFKPRYGLTEEFLRIVVASSAGIMIIIFWIFLRQELFNSRFLVMGGWFFAIVFVFLGRILMRAVQRYLVGKHDFGIQRIAFIGDNGVAQAILDEIESNAALGYRIVYRSMRPNVTELREAHAREAIDRIILASTQYSQEEILDLVDFCHENHVAFKYVPNIHQTLMSNFDIDVIRGVPLIELRQTALGGWGRVMKRVIDIFLASLGLLILSPFFLIIGLIIKLTSDGPVFVRLQRMSQNKQFGLLKFRSMIKDAEALKQNLIEHNERKDGPLFKMKNDPRVTGVGRFLRRTRIDELPQFWNVLKGDMSLVGPRPHQPDEVAQYQKHHRKVLAIKAGATGLAQVSGSSDLPFEREVAIDSYYIDNWTLFLDLKVILKTVFKMLYDRSAV